MIKMLDGSSGNVVGLKYSGKITGKDYEAMTPQLAKLVEEQGTINVLMDLADVKDITPKAMFDDFAFMKDYGQKVAKVAMVSDSKWEEMAAEFSGAVAKLLKAEIKYFPVSQIDDAWAWLRACDCAKCE